MPQQRLIFNARPGCTPCLPRRKTFGSPPQYFYELYVRREARELGSQNWTADREARCIELAAESGLCLCRACLEHHWYSHATGDHLAHLQGPLAEADDECHDPTLASKRRRRC